MDNLQSFKTAKNTTSSIARLALRGQTADTVTLVLFNPFSAFGSTRGEAVIITVQTTNVRQQSPEKKLFWKFKVIISLTYETHAHRFPFESATGVLLRHDDRRRMTTIEVTMITWDLCCHNIKLIYLCNVINRWCCKFAHYFPLLPSQVIASMYSPPHKQWSWGKLRLCCHLYCYAPLYVSVSFASDVWPRPRPHPGDTGLTGSPERES